VRVCSLTLLGGLREEFLGNRTTKGDKEDFLGREPSFNRSISQRMTSRPAPAAAAAAPGGAQAQRPNNGSSTQNKICQFKLVLLGESAVGKSSLVLRFVKGQFHEYQESTIGAAFFNPNRYAR